MQNQNPDNLSDATASLTGPAGPNQTISVTMPASALVSSAILPATGVNRSGAETDGGTTYLAWERGPSHNDAGDFAGRFLAGIQTGVTGAVQSSTGVVTLSGAAPIGGAPVELPTSVVGGSHSSTAMVRLSGPAAAAGAQVQLTSNCGFASVF